MLKTTGRKFHRQQNQITESSDVGIMRFRIQNVSAAPSLPISPDPNVNHMCSGSHVPLYFFRDAVLDFLLFQPHSAYLPQGL